MREYVRIALKFLGQFSIHIEWHPWLRHDNALLAGAWEAFGLAGRWTLDAPYLNRGGRAIKSNQGPKE
jgi:hypothetical protein